MKILRTCAVIAMLVVSSGFMLGCASKSSGCGCSAGTCECAPDRNCCDGCRQGSGCTCNR